MKLVGQIASLSGLRNAYKLCLEAKVPFLRPRLRKGLISRSQEMDVKVRDGFICLRIG
jgi:hypothetical protein